MSQNMPSLVIFVRVPARPRNHADRRDLILRTLADRPGITAVRLADEFGTSVRTIFRDLDELRDRGYPVESSRGRGGGLRLASRWGLGRVLLSRGEALATLVALAIAERVGLPLFGDDLARARRRLVDAFPRGERRTLAPLRRYRRADGRVHTRTVEPHVLLINWPAWYILAWDHSRDAARTFRIDRIAAATVDDQTFGPRPTALLAEAARDVLATVDAV